MGRPSRAKAMSVWMNGTRVGTWRLTSRAVDEFEYDQAWVASDRYRPLSLSLPAPAGGGPLRGDNIRNYFDNLLPDSDVIRRRLQDRFRTDSLSPFDLLAAVGRDCVGAIQLLPENEAPPNIEVINGIPLDEGGVEHELVRVVSTDARGQRDDEDDALRISIAGAQEKTALLWHDGRWCRPMGATPSTHIFKLPLGTVGGRKLDLETSVENEWLCLKLLEAFGLQVAEAEMKVYGSQKCLVVKRFDRVLHSSGRFWLRLAQEDMCQATGTPGVRKYEEDGGPGILQLATLLRQSDDPDDVERFLRTLVIFWMLRAMDGHAKNFSIALRAGGRFSMTPAYDVLSAWPVMGHGANLIPHQKAKMAMAWIGKNRHYHADRIQPRHFLETARQCGFADGLIGMLSDLAETSTGAVEELRAQLPPKFPEHVANSVFTGVLASTEELSAGLSR